MDGRPTVITGLTPLRAVVTAVVVAAVVVLSISRTIPFDSDEARHANLALKQYQDLRDLRFMDFLRHSYRTGEFPFFHGWTVVPVFALLGTTAFAARAAQCAHFVLGVAATAYAGYRVCGDDRRAGGVAGTLFALSPALATYSGLCMLETPGAAMTAVAIACLAEALRADGRRGTLCDVFTAAAVLATWFTKLNYGIWILPAIAVGYVVPIGRHIDWRRALRGLATYLGVVGVVLGAWYSTASQRAAFHGFLTNPAQAVSIVEDDPTFRLPAFSTDNFSAYFTLVPRDFHVHWILGAAVLLFFVVGTVRALRDRSGAVAAAAACVGWTWLSLSMGFREYALARFIAPALPAVWIVAAYGAAPLLAKVSERRWFRVVGGAAFAVALVVQLATVRVRLAGPEPPEIAWLVPSATDGPPPVEYEVDDRFRPVFTHLTETLAAPASVQVMNYTDHTSARTLEWELGSAPGRRYSDFDVKTLIGERIYESDRAFDAWLDTPRSWGDATWNSFIVEMVPGPGYLDAPQLVPATVRMWHDAILRRAPGRLQVVSSKTFEGLGLTVKVWRDLKPPPQVPAGASGN